jgi:hypothetical protein
MMENPLFIILTAQGVHGETVLIGPFPVAAYNDADGLVTFTITSYVEGEDAVAILYI